MKKFIIKLFFFFVPVLILSVPLDIILSKYISKSSDISREADEYSVWNYVYSNEHNSDLIILGSSRAWVHIDPNILEEKLDLSTYNLGMDGSGFEMHKLRFDEISKDGFKPKVLVYSLDYSTLIKRNEIYKYEQFLPYMLWNINLYRSLNKFQPFNTLDFFIPLFRFSGQSQYIRRFVTDVLKPNNKKIKRDNGFKSQDKIWDPDFKAQKTVASIELIDNENLSMFKEFLAQLKENDIKTILTYTPEYSKRIDENYKIKRDEILMIYHGIADSLQLSFLDYTGYSSTLDSTNFYNIVHLNRKGAKKFSEVLSEDIYSIIVK